MKYKNHKQKLVTIKHALADYEKSNSSLTEISQKYNIPISTLNYYKGRNIIVKKSYPIEKSDEIEDTIKPNDYNVKKVNKIEYKKAEENFDKMIDKFGLNKFK